MEHEWYMMRCMELRRHGLAGVSPNPMVGCVIVHKGKIIGEGYHHKSGNAHAEVLAINSVKNKNLLNESSLYVSMEPCCHHGKTPPCTDLILKHRIREVIIGMKDPFEKVKGKSIKLLRKNGVKGITGILSMECRRLNRRFITAQEKQRPYIILKWAESRDAFMAPACQPERGKAHWISDEFSRWLVHKWRSEEDAIMIGTNTAFADNPKLNVRHVKGKNPVRIVIDKKLKLPLSLHLFDQSIRTIVFASANRKPSGKIEYVTTDFRKFPSDALQKLHRLGIQSVIVEGGKQLLESFIASEIWDEARIFISPEIISDGIKAPFISGTVQSDEILKNDTLRIITRTDVY